MSYLCHDQTNCKQKHYPSPGTGWSSPLCSTSPGQSLVNVHPSNMLSSCQGAGKSSAWTQAMLGPAQAQLGDPKAALAQPHMW